MHQIRIKRYSKADILQIETEDYAHARRIRHAQDLGMYTSPSEARSLSYAAAQEGGRIAILTDKGIIIISEDDARLMAMEMPLVLERFRRKRERRW